MSDQTLIDAMVGDDFTSGLFPDPYGLITPSAAVAAEVNALAVLIHYHMTKYSNVKLDTSQKRVILNKGLLDASSVHLIASKMPELLLQRFLHAVVDGFTKPVHPDALLFVGMVEQFIRTEAAKPDDGSSDSLFYMEEAPHFTSINQRFA